MKTGPDIRSPRAQPVPGLAARLVPLPLIAFLGGCGGPEPPRKAPFEAEMVVPAAPAGAARTLPRGARIEASGFGTVLSAPPSAYEPPPPPEPLVPAEAPARGGPAVAPQIAHLIRLLPRILPPPPGHDAGRLTTLEALPITKTIVILRDGCFRLSEPGAPLVLFTIGTRAFLDSEGYVAVGPADLPRSLSGRVGEPVRWEGRIEPVREAHIAAGINRVCGRGQVVRIGLPSSEAAQTSVEDASTAREMSVRYGTTYREARAEVRACRTKANRRWAELRARYGDRDPPVELIPGPCMLTPPLPVAAPADCPPKTELSGGLCRNEKGHVVPVPPRRPMG